MLRLFALLLFFPLLGQAAEETNDALRERAQAALSRLVPQAKLEQVRASSVDGMLELVVDGNVLYLSADGKHLFQGNVFDTARATNLTEQSRSSLRKDGIAKLSESTLIRFAPKAPTHEVTVFTAIDCAYCRRFHQDIEEYLDAGIAVNYVLIPLGGAGSAADQASRQVHCAADRPQAFTAATFGQSVEARAECPSGYQAGIDLAARLGITNTPTLIGSNGELIGGYLSAKDLLAKLVASTP
ncbi:DsbC family protein [Pseudomarimonas arenosa]|uniref:Thiol:disulfide interchange protein n=1 Tax=Pseudomarimonas arenosa TaxID=2774145 RepID=A0AAW3ZNH2_9GAMM|nr:DsbC family protein [Pseudomarimonas arenosa]MBD8527641.1 DsbC family protein [Pseudomarimonas arenosa]